MRGSTRSFHGVVANPQVGRHSGLRLPWRATWDKYPPQQSVDHLASKGVNLDVPTIQQLLVDAKRHCLKRQAEAAERRKSRAPRELNLVASRPSTLAVLEPPQA